MTASAEECKTDGSTRLDTPAAASNREGLHDETATDAAVDAPYSVYSRREKWVIVSIASVAGIFSPLTANIYFPVIPTMVDAFHTTTELINLTVTLYMVFQGVSPMLFGTLSDTVGRRIISMTCLLILSLSCVGLALVPTSAYWLLLLLRCVQAAGSASTVVMGSGIIGDIAPPSERAGFFGVYGAVPLIGPAIGPVLGGALADHLGWRSIFWFLCISSASTAVMVFLIMPETLRTIMGNGSVVPPRIYRPVVPLIKSKASPTTSSLPKAKLVFKNPLPLLLNLDIVLLLIFNGIFYAVFYAVTASISVLFMEAYPYLDETTTGLLFLSIGGGMAIGSVCYGRILDWDFERVRRSMGDSSHDQNDSRGRLGNFPIEKARLRLVPICFAFSVAATVGYGWCLELRVNIAGPLTLMFIIGASQTAVMNAAQALIIDYVPKQSSSVTACNNLIRCSLGAAAVASVDPILRRLNPGWTYVLLPGICVVVSPFLFIVMKIGPSWRKKRSAREGSS